MEQFKKASQLKLRFNTDRGLLSVEQLWDLSQNQLSNLIRSIKKVLKETDNDDELSFLTGEVKLDEENQLRFDIAKDIYLTKKKAQEEIRDASAIKEYNEKILGLIEEKQEEGLKGKSIEELEALLK
jgi:hypothetical protein